ncbi:MAG: hypothetical protein FWC01_04705 [Treponema sp.]|nr:hypothetical protein [Treponema sp.]MCL2237222.1 hypothetical protein [Treponema sp.]
MSDIILLVFEGETIEEQIFNSIKSNFFSYPNSNTIIKSSFCGEIFQLWDKVKDDPDLSIVEILKEKPDSGIGNLDRDDVSEVHLFFDHDAHSVKSRPRESQQEYNEKICSLLKTFNNESEMGKLWISYPMAEALKHIKTNPNDCFNDARIAICDYSNYKDFVSKNSDYLNIKKYDQAIWNKLTIINVQRTFCLINDEYKDNIEYDEIENWFEENAIIVKMIQDKQYLKFISKKNEVVALSPFPLFLLNYFGKPFLNVCKNEEQTKSCSFGCYK